MAEPKLKVPKVAVVGECAVICAGRMVFLPDMIGAYMPDIRA